MNKKRIIYSSAFRTSFTKLDERYLESSFVVDHFFFNAKVKWKTPFYFLGQFFYLLWNIRRCDALVCNFAGYHSFLPGVFGKIFGKPVLIILAGTDCVSFPSIGYGNFNRKPLSWFTGWSLKLCSCTMPVHSSLVYTNYTYTKDDYEHQGYLFHSPGAQKEFVEIPYGYTTDRFRPLGKKRIKGSFLTVSQSLKSPVFERKGIDLILKAAKELPELKFAVVGLDRQFPAEQIPKNVELIPPVKYEELINIYNSYEYYMQFSICEGFPNTLCEGMMCGCVPLGSDVAAIPHIIHDTGLILKNKNVSELVALLRRSIELDITDLSVKASSRIYNEFPETRRIEEFRTTIEKFIERKKK